MSSKVIKYIVAIGLLTFLGFKSVYFRKLSDMRGDTTVNTFDAGAFSRDLLRDKLPAAIDSAVGLGSLISQLQTDPEQAFNRHARALAIGNVGYFLVTGEGTIRSHNDTGLTIVLKDNASKSTVKIATEFIYGNAIRDASGLVRLSDFNNTADLNSISEQINSIIRKEVLPPVVTRATDGVVVRFDGAIELNRKYIDLDTIEVVPIRLTLLN